MADRERNALDFGVDAAIVYDGMSKSRVMDAGREILAAHGLVEWLISFNKLASINENRKPCALSSIVPAEPAEDIVVIFANMLLEATTQ